MVLFLNSLVDKLMCVCVCVRFYFDAIQVKTNILNPLNFSSRLLSIIFKNSSNFSVRNKWISYPLETNTTKKTQTFISDSNQMSGQSNGGSLFLSRNSVRG